MKKSSLPKLKENEIQRSILDYLQIKGYCCFRNNTGAMPAIYNGKKRFIRFGSVGWPDIIGMTKFGKFFGIEVKSYGGKPTDAQVAVGNSIVKNNGIYLVARSLDDVIGLGF